jgi:hypothetical protein
MDFENPIDNLIACHHWFKHGSIRNPDIEGGGGFIENSITFSAL